MLPGLRVVCKCTARHEWYQHVFRRLTPSQHVVPEELLLPHKDGHNDERVEVNAFAQHPEVVGGAGVLVEHRQHLAADLEMGSSGGLKKKEKRKTGAAGCVC